MSLDHRLSRAELVALADRIIRLESTGSTLDEWIATFKANVADPSVLDLVFWSDAPITAEELVERGLNPPRRRSAEAGDEGAPFAAAAPSSKGDR